jgi:hypothetical protein
MSNKNLHNASKAKKDEFYTQLPDIEKELKYYKQHFKGKVVYCNCDDPYESNFFKYFTLNFNFLGLKKLIATSYIGSPISNTQLSLFDNETVESKTTRHPHKIIINELTDENNDKIENLEDIVISLTKNKNNTLTRLKGDGDFRSEECVDFLKQADIVVTNPPFSLFREYVTQLMEYDKKFLIIGHQNAITYKELFKFIKEDKIWLGYGFNRNMAHFINVYYKDYATDRDHKEGMIRVSGIAWFTNLDVKKRHNDLPLYRTYNRNDYQKYDNYDAINIDKTKDIPCDYDDVMGVPITFLEKYNPDQFEIVGQMVTTKIDEYNFGYPYIKGEKIYARILIKKKGK